MERRVLIVDDEPEITAVVKSYLEREGMSVAIATSAAMRSQRSSDACPTSSYST